MKSSSNCLVSAIIALWVTSPTIAHKIRPYDVTTKSLKMIHRGWLKDLAPVHETLSKVALACANANPNGDRPCTVEDIQYDNTDGQHPLLKGSHWNDDPNNLFEGDHAVEWAYWLTNGNKRSQAGTLNKTMYLTYRSHYYDLQFLHSMSLKGQPPISVQSDIIEWCKFAYGVAVGTIDGSMVIHQLQDQYPFVMHLNGTGPAFWTVRRLFTNIGQDYFRPNDDLEGVSDRDLQWRAAGALLHTIQDSYSNSHCERESSGDDLNPPSGAIHAFLDYSSQDHDCHGTADLEPRWIFTDAALRDGPIPHGAWVLRRVLAKKPWDQEMESYLRNTVFPLSDNSRSADGGACSNLSKR